MIVDIFSLSASPESRVIDRPHSSQRTWLGVTGMTSGIRSAHGWRRKVATVRVAIAASAGRHCAGSSCGGT